MEDQDKFLKEAATAVKKNAYFMKKAMVRSVCSACSAASSTFRHLSISAGPMYAAADRPVACM